MHEQTQHTPNPTPQPIDTKALDQASDDALHDLIGKAQALLTQRENSRKREAIFKIKELAKAHGLDVTIEPTKRGRGRPRKKD
ncbi:hypothetical protein SAMN05216196_1155 [Lutimaribacter pacificus]|uniref:H-NS histone family protein n=1 Tax=Lutimaribacter pacificus TaxID=391948 RepID=A0A1H0NZX1_9RHOB|nr:H-NS histone family protein [Lutimaribacter pacificus]SDO98058.1 hypothetical protein SAMN05216196_1155 [Lutimaribacter pacificus]SHK97265.1 hypothetical protein SAMN05444142_1154 [Lutimaribacter pacificus]